MQCSATELTWHFCLKNLTCRDSDKRKSKHLQANQTNQVSRTTLNVDQNIYAKYPL